MTLSTVAAVDTWLKSRHISVPKDWLEACVEWITEENQGVQLSQTQLNGLVFEQWLLADLHEIGSNCLPEKITSTTKFQLNGTFALQVDSMVDVGKPYYGQLQKVQGANNANVEVTAEPTPPWEPKPTRMMMLNLTDGSISVQGMEYKQIVCLNSQVKPGCKILVKGSIPCRRGILMLTADNLTVLGSEVDTLIETNTPENALKLAMERSVQYSGNEYRQDFSRDGMIKGKSKKMKMELPSEAQQLSTKGTTQAAEPVKDRAYSRVIQKQEVSKVEDEWGDDGWLEDIDDFEMETVPPQMTTSTSVNPQSSGQCKTKASNQHPLRKNLSVPQVSVKHNVSPLVVSDSSGTGQGNSGYRNESFQRSDYQAVRKTNSKTGVCDIPNNNGKHGAFPANQTPVTVVSNNQPQKTYHSGLASDIDKSVIEENLFDDMDDFDMSACDEDGTMPLTKQGGLQEVNKNTFISRGTEKPLLPVLRRKMFNSSKSPENIKKEITTSQPTTDQRQKTHSNTTIQSKIVTPRGEEEKATKKPISIAITSPLRIQNQQTTIDELPVDAEPFTYLSFVKKQMPVSQLIKFKVKAYVSTLTDKLSRPAGIKWHLPCKINDGSAVMDVNLSDKVLTDLIGFSAQETMEMKLMKPDSFLMKRLNKGIQNCQQSIINLLCVMEIVIVPGETKPEVLSVRDLNEEDLVTLQTRVSNAICKADI